MNRKFKYQTFKIIRLPNTVIFKFKNRRAAKRMFDRIEINETEKRKRLIFVDDIIIEYMPQSSEIWFMTKYGRMKTDYIRFIKMCGLTFIDD